MTLEVRLSGQVGALALQAAFSAPPGVSVLQGASGSGKTSLLRAIAGLDRLPGEVRLGTEVWQDARSFVAPHLRRIGFVFQGANLLPHLSVRANLAYAADRAEAALQIAYVADHLGITSLLDRRPAKLSGGEAQRVALARALLIRPRLLLLDEPLTGLDSIARGAVAETLADMLPTLAIPILLVTHDRAEAARLASHCFTIADGKLSADS